jgi:hypothetical protein
MIQFRFILFTIYMLGSLSLDLQAKELAGVDLPDQITTANGETLVLNGIGLREKLWVDVYIGALYVGKKTNDAEGVLSQPGALRIQMNFLYKEVDSKKLNKAWREGFQKNQDQQTLSALQDRIKIFYSFFEDSALKGDLYVIDYIPGEGSSVFKNGALLGTIEGEDFKNAVVEIWLGDSPADRDLKEGMLGLQ